MGPQFSPSIIISKLSCGRKELGKNPKVLSLITKMPKTCIICKIHFTICNIRKINRTLKLQGTDNLNSGGGRGGVAENNCTRKGYKNNVWENWGENAFVED